MLCEKHRKKGDKKERDASHRSSPPLKLKILKTEFRTESCPTGILYFSICAYYTQVFDRSQAFPSK
jgi:hypothetical protein